MTMLEMGLIAAGLSMDVFAWTACRSTLFSCIGRKKLLCFTGAFGVWEFVSVSLGFYMAELLRYAKLLEGSERILKLLAAVIFLVLAFRMLFISIGGKQIDEHRQDEVAFLPLLQDSSAIAGRTFLAGLAVSLCNTGAALQYVLLLLSGILMAVLGLYAGYAYGFQVRTKALVTGFICLMAADIIFVSRFL